MFATPSAPEDATPKCYMGSGNQCWTEAEGDNAIGSVALAERLQHGQVRVLKDALTDQVLDGLVQQFGENVMVKQADNTEVAMPPEAQTENCRVICHSNVQCTFWQSYYRDGQSDNMGCWTEAPGADAAGAAGNGGFVQYPTTLTAYKAPAPDWMTGDTPGRITGGQYIQHFCPVPTLPTRPPTTTTTTTTLAVPADNTGLLTATPAPSGGFMNPWGYVLIVAGLLIGLGAVALLMMSQQKPPPKKGGTRAVKPIKKKEEPPPPPAAPPQPLVPLVAQPIMVQPTIPQPLTMTTIQQPTTVAAQAIAQPLQMSTYAGAPMVARPY
jgi:hypothetical protein